MKKGVLFSIISNMRNLKYLAPYSDGVLNWNEKTKKYELTMEYVKENFDISFRDDKVLSRRLRKNTDKVYNYINSVVYSGNQLIVKNIINKSEQGRKFIIDVLKTQFEADNETGYNDLTLQPAINVSNGQILDRNEFIRNKVSVDTEELIDNSIDYFGFNLLVQVPFPQAIFIYLNDFTKK